jgi:tRNA U34 2-thiouridine synthase MnmA/TrmU
MFSGGLDSVCATHMLMQQGLDITALHFVLPFESSLGFSHSAVKQYADALGVKLFIEEEGVEFLDMVKNPHFGYGKHANPCVDCRIYRLQKAAQIMNETGAQFIATGEVLGQRPMSQRRDSMLAVEKRSGLKGFLLRPLSAKLLDPTVPEKEGWVDREKLYGISGRGRKEQLAYAVRFGLKHGAPGGGCLLTQKETGARFTDLRQHCPAFNISDFKLCAYGRHFRINDSCRLIVGRNKFENDMLARLIAPDDWRMQMAHIEGPLAIVRGIADTDSLNLCASVVARYSRARTSATGSVKALRGDEALQLHVKPASDATCAALRI